MGENTTMTERKQSPSTRREQGSSLAWKSSLIASSVGGLLLGWALLGQANPAPASKVAQIVAPQPRVIVVQVSIPAASNGNQQFASQPAQQVQPAQASGQAAPAQPAQANTQAALAQNAPAPASPQVSLPSMPQKPVFQQPVTRTRGS